jgi:hypothetical protein
MIVVVIDHMIATRRVVEACRGRVIILRPRPRRLVSRIAPFVWLVQVLQMQHLQGIHMCGVEASHVTLLGPREKLRYGRCGG